MKIYILPVKPQFQPSTPPFAYPVHNDNYGVEQDFWNFVCQDETLITDNPARADWHYLPIFWTHWHLNHDYARTGLEDLAQEVQRVLKDDSKTFTICQYTDGPVVDSGATTVFLSSRKTENGIDIPLLSKNHKIPWLRLPKRHLASFTGRLDTHPLRQAMLDILADRPKVVINDGNLGTRHYVRQMLASWIALCPRGYGGSSFRLYEAMQLGVVPLVIGDLDTRPFKSFLDWEKFSLYTSKIENINNQLDAHSIAELRQMGQVAKMIYQQKLTFGKWCKYVLQELERI